MRYIFLLLWLALAGPIAAPAQAAPGTQRELSVGADFCAILRAFTQAGDPRCPAPENGAPRSAGPPAGQVFSRAAAPVETQGSPPGYFIRFAFNSIDLTPEYRAHLDRLSQVFRSQAMAGVCIKLVGHTDVVGDEGYNRRLSLARARVVAAHLRRLKALPEGRLSADGLGEARPIPGMPGTHPLNRRVEILARSASEAGCA